MSLDERKVADYWDIDIKEIKKLSDRAALLISADDEKYVLKKKGSVKELHHEVELLHYLHAQQIKVHMPLLNSLGDYVFTYDNENYTLYHYLEGTTLSPKECLQNKTAAELIGKTIGQFHKAMNNKTISNKFIEKDLYNIVYGWAVKEIFANNVDADLKRIYENLEGDLFEAVNELPRQLIHRDAHTANMIVKDDTLSGLIDFDLTEVNVRIFDICYCATSILSEIFYEAPLRKKWTSFFGELVRSYHNSNPLQEKEQYAIWYVMLSIQTIFMAYFVKDPNLYKMNKEMFIWIYENKLEIDLQSKDL